jgi:hypothetical protein
MSEEVDPRDYSRAQLFNRRLAFTENFSLVTKGFLARGARARVVYGKNVNAIADARAILELAREWSDVRDTKAEWSFFQDTNTQIMMRWLMICVVDEPEYLRDIVDTLIQLKKGGVKTANHRRVALELITAYQSCPGYYPTLPEIHRTFIERFPKSRWPGDVSARRTLRALDIPLGKAMCGRPRKQLRKLIHKKS